MSTEWTRAVTFPEADVAARRRLFALMVGAVAMAWIALGVHVLAPGGWSVWEVALLFCILANAPWLALGGVTGLLGFLVRLRASSVGEAATHDPLVLRTLLAVCVRDEAMPEVLQPLAALMDGLKASGHGDAFAIAILSDTQDNDAAAREEAAVSQLAAARPQGEVIYRRRADNVGYKAGNVMEFLDHHAGGFSLLLLLDADSVMEPALVLQMVRSMQQEPGLAILQSTVTGGEGATSFACLLGHGHAPGMLTWAAGQDWWQGGEGPFWGHNALLRIAPFRQHCRLETLPDGSAILSHDHVEAARLHQAGWEVRVLPTPQGSFEAHPPNVAEFLERDRRWNAGNMQYRHLLLNPALGVLGRLQMLQAMLHYALAPLWFAMLPLAVLNAMEGAEGTPRGSLLVLLLSGYGLLHLPRLAGHALNLMAAPAGRRGRVMRDAAAESGFILLFDSIAALDKSLTVLSHAFRLRRAGWPVQQRRPRAILWREAVRRFWPHSIAGLLLLGLLITSGSAFAVAVALPALAGLIGSIPFCVMTARPRAAAS
ncbi:glucans biosynthesis glucosyltransferase MdoH [Pseudoroseomonas globiformis]|uniref:Glucans biosynthesis glucosyltransferase H n=1 Tax=Teichococcus globiformis TaxID=2307229 RepID=A0ABV7FYM9_9PROT